MSYRLHPERSEGFLYFVVVPDLTAHTNPTISLRSSTIPTLRPLALVLLALLRATALHASPVPVRFHQGSAHVFLSLTNLDGKSLAFGDFSQTEHAGRLTAHLVFHFHDGSVDEETTTFTQRGTFHLLRDHHVQRGPSFPHPIDMLIDVPTGEVTSRTPDGNGNGKTIAEHLDLPPDLSNGLVLTLLLNVSPTVPVTELSLLAPGPKPRLVHLAITPVGNDPFTVAGSHRTSTHFLGRIEIGGLAGIMAPIVGKQPKDIHMWVYEGDAPAMVKLQGQMYEDGPVWCVGISGPIGPTLPSN